MIFRPSRFPRDRTKHSNTEYVKEQRIRLNLAEKAGRSGDYWREHEHSIAAQRIGRTLENRGIQTGPKGGMFTLTPGGSKVYLKK